MKRKIFKKLMAYTLVGAMTISTPIVASAEEETSIADVYTSTDDGEGTGTLSGTATGTYKYEHELKDKEAQVVGLALDKDSLALEKNGEVNTGRLQARVLYNDYDPSDEEMVLAADAATKKIIDNYLKWEVVDGNGVVGLSYYEKADGEKDRGMVNVTAKTGGNATVKVFIDYNVNGECDAGEYSAQATVSVKEYANSIKLVNLEDKYYLRHKYDLNDNVALDPATATDKVSFYITSTDAKDTKSVVISDAGIMTVKKMPAGEVTLHAVTEKGKPAEAKITFDAGVGANKVIANPDKVGLDFGDCKTTAPVSVTLEAKEAGKTVTDAVEWSTKQTKVVSVTVDPEDDTKATITAVGVGTATVTAKATSGKKATIKVTVESTPKGVAVYGADSTYTGKALQLTAVALDKNGEKIPTGKTKFEFTLKDKSKNIKVNKSKGLVTSVNLLVDASNKPIDTDKATVQVIAKYKSVKTNPVTKDIIVNQADIDDITVVNATTKNDVIVAGQKNNNNNIEKNIFAGRGYQYVATALPDATLSEAISWASSNKKVGTVSDNGLFTAIKGGTTKITASYVNVTTDSKGKSKAKVEKKTITVKAVQKATSLTLNKNVFVVKAGTKSVSINVKKQLPSGSKDTILWKTVKASLNNNKTEVIEGSKNVAGTGKNNAKVVIPVSDLKAGTVVKVGAFADGGAVSYAYIYVVDNKASGVQLINKTSKAKITNKDLKDIAVGTTVPFTPQVKVNGKFVDTVEYTRENIAYAADPVTYSFSKAGIATIDNGSIKALKPGTTKLTVKTASGKKTTLTIKVK
ncbi:MAG: Ig-like domain-containing protein [Lachnospiraceae bacterium]|nr:Ig-like domain-containing protein [Lachnospiraceae bacterium]